MSPNFVDTVIDVANRIRRTIDTQSIPSESNNFMTLDKFDSVEYDSVHLWECQIDGAPSPFNQWFPAQSIDEPTKGMSVSTKSFGLEEINELNTYNAISLRTELIDDSKSTLEQWLRQWQKDCSVENYNGYRYLDQILHSMRITKYTWQKQKVYTREYFVIPVGQINIAHGNDPALKVLNVNFASFGQREL